MVGIALISTYALALVGGMALIARIVYFPPPPYLRNVPTIKIKQSHYLQQLAHKHATMGERALISIHAPVWADGMALIALIVCSTVSSLSSMLSFLADI